MTIAHPFDWFADARRFRRSDTQLAILPVVLCLGGVKKSNGTVDDEAILLYTTLVSNGLILFTCVRQPNEHLTVRVCMRNFLLSSLPLPRCHFDSRSLT